MHLFKIVKYSVPTRFQVRTTSTGFYKKSKTIEECKMNYVVKEVERIVGYPTSFLNLRWILNDEIANVASHINKLTRTSHPLLKTARNLLVPNEMPSWGLIVLLISKMAGLSSKFPVSECDTTAGILHSQRILAEITEMIKTSHLMHKSLVNIDPNEENASDFNFGNKLALLCGDSLLSKSFHEVACLKNSNVQLVISSILRDLAESEFVGPRNQENFPIPSKPLPIQQDVAISLEPSAEPFQMKHIRGNMKAEWTLMNILGGASLLGKSCQCTLMLANHDSHVQGLGYSFGINLALAWQAFLEKDALKEKKFSLVSAPVMFHLEEDPDLYGEIEKGVQGEDNVDYDLIRNIVMEGPAFAKTHNVQIEFSQAALEILEKFPNSDSKTALVNIINSM